MIPGLFGELGMGEMLLIFLVVLLLYGAKRLPSIGESLGRGIREFKGSVREIEDEVKLQMLPPFVRDLVTSSPHPVTSSLRVVLTRACVEAAETQHAEAGTPHLLLALTRMPDGDVAALLHGLDVDAQQLRWRVKEGLMLGATEKPTEMAFSYGAAHALTLTIQEADALGHHAVAPAHLVLGLLAEGGRAAETLASLGVTLEEARVAAARLLG